MKIKLSSQTNESSLALGRRTIAFTRSTAFSLVEVMIATAIFFTALFSILAIVSQCIRNAAALSQNAPTIGMVASQLSLTNKLEEGSDSGDFETLAAGAYPDYDWTSDTIFYASNGMYQVDIVISHKGNVDSSGSILLYRPESISGNTVRSAFGPRR